MIKLEAQEHGEQTAESVEAPSFEIVFKGDISPDRVGFGDIATALRAFGHLARGEDSDAAEVPTRTTVPLNLVRVECGSAVYRVQAPSDELGIFPHLAAVGRILKINDIESSHEYMFMPIKALSLLAKKHHVTIEARYVGSKEVIATISPTSYGDVFQTQMYGAKSQFIAKIERVGGASKLRCGLRISSRSRMLICRVKGRAVARELGNLLYDAAMVRGYGHWFKKNFTLLSFTIEGVKKLKRPDLNRAMSDLRDAGMSAWDKIDDVQSFLRGDDEGEY